MDDKIISTVKEDTPISRYLDDMRRIEDSINLLKRLGGGVVELNPFRDSIIRLEGYLVGAKMCERAVDL